jgi:esterase
MNLSATIRGLLIAAFGIGPAAHSVASELPPDVKSLRVNGYDMAYVERGSGPPMVLVHGANSDYRFFSEVMDAFAARHRVISVSLRHYYPERWDGKGADFSMRQHVADIAEFIRKLGAGPVHLVGHSRGGTLALYLASAHGDLVRTVAISEGGSGMPAFAPQADGDGKKPSRPGPTAAAMIEQGRVEEGLAYFMDSVRGPGGWQNASETDRQFYRDNAATIGAAAKDKFDSYSCADAGRIAVPVLLMGAESSPRGYAKQLDAIQACLKQPTRVLIRNSSHSMPRMNPPGFAQAVLAFIAQQ